MSEIVSPGFAASRAVAILGYAPFTLAEGSTVSTCPAVAGGLEQFWKKSAAEVMLAEAGWMAHQVSKTSAQIGIFMKFLPS